MEGHRKIELQAPEDLAYLLANVRRAAAARLDEAFPPVDGANAGGEGDELRTRIEELVNEYITKTFELASPNLSINGMPVNASHFLSGSGDGSAAALRPEEVFEPFDARKRARVEELSREEEDLLRDIAALKKSVPGAAAQAWADAARKSVADDEHALAAANERASASAPPTASADGGDDGGISGSGSSISSGSKLFEEVRKPLERQDEVEGSYEDAVAGLAKLKREMPSVVARMERARSAGEYVVTER
ncbi:uncharacterized protein F4807DRAFT_175158 [Annulohypoxylon truncatum]|uniref:uncharacterized protein n=1 Tax=Annulohypoxylon truncatum TaxID=327061 RepID=UPI00200784E7|nr:uncharacterized protein F4807DRAFT_175158 [Annulohypoxylon truncatum]KAI1207704.1 hypothetical protein F4807DRAFT_175158 [Annulohypoxylon truncatum]